MSVDSVIVICTASGMDSIEHTLTLLDTTAKGYVTGITAGPARIFSVRAFSHDGSLTHSGSDTSDISPDNTAEINVELHVVGGNFEPEIIWVHMIWDNALYNAFTDLIRYRQAWYCAFRESDAHVLGEDGKIRIIESSDGVVWQSVALLSKDGVDLRDPKLSITPDDRLMLLAGGSVYVDGINTERKTRVAFSYDGSNWSPFQSVPLEYGWLWRVTWHLNDAFGVAYNPASNIVTLYRGSDGISYQPVKVFDLPVDCTETTVRFSFGNEAIALVRHDTDGGWIGSSISPYTEWTWREIQFRLGGPNFIFLPDGSMVATSRRYEASGTTTIVAKMTLDTFDPVLHLPSGGDTSYAGMVWYDNHLWISYYSSHEGRPSIYLAKLNIFK